MQTQGSLLFKGNTAQALITSSNEKEGLRNLVLFLCPPHGVTPDGIPNQARKDKQANVVLRIS